jgi:hypothetical protein
MESSLPEQKKEIAVVYLSWLPYGIEHLKQFVGSYNSNAPGYDHRLILLFNGTGSSSELNGFLSYARSNLKSFEFFEMPRGQDIDAYFFIAQKRPEQYLLFLNTLSRFNGDGWLKKYADVMDNKKVGVVSATASNQSLYNTVYQTNKWYWEYEKGFRHNFRKYKMFVKAFVYWRFLIKPFPNPHVRTNAFMIERTLFSSLKKKGMASKFDAYLFESGRQSMTNQVIKLGYEPLVIGKDGKAYKVNEWKNSDTFWTGEQKNLMIKDNQTELYQNATPDYRRYLTFICWGK